MNDFVRPRPHGWQLRRLGLFLFLVTAVLPVYSCRAARPSQFEALPGKSLTRRRARSKPGDVPVKEIASQFELGWERNPLVGPVWYARDWYPYLLAPVWMAALLAAARGAAAIRRRLAWGMLGLSAAVGLFEGVYLHHDYPSSGRAFGRFEWVAIWFLVWVALFFRPKRKEDPVGAIVSAQALLCFFHALTFPLNDLIDWREKGYGFMAIFRTIAACYLPAFWLAVWALLLVALPGYLPPSRFRASAGEPSSG